tara:strand:+ start:308 stop:1015 length:708 start_codon:yes stop_codon:yes gene_type:complete
MQDKDYFIVTGSNSGLGKNLVKNLNDKGFKTLGIDVVDGEYTDLKFDLSKLSDENVKEIQSKLGECKIKSIIHCAAVQKNPDKNFESLTKTFDEVFGVNVKSIYLLVKLLETSFHKPSNLCLISSVHSNATTENNTLYASSKAALKGVLHGLTLEKKDEMSIFELVLGAMESPMLLNSYNKNEIENLKNELPSKKILTTNEVASFIIDLIIKHTNILHGSSIILDNGVLSKLSTR